MGRYMGDDIVIRISKNIITVNGIECNKHNFNEVFSNANIQEYEANQIIDLLLATTRRKVRIFHRE